MVCLYFYRNQNRENTSLPRGAFHIYPALVLLHEAGIIASTVVRLAPKKLGLDLCVLIHIRMDRHTPERFDNFESIVGGYPEVQECYLITGQEADYQLKIIVPNMDEYQRFLLEKITRIEGVIGVHSSFVLRRAVDSTALPLKYLKQ